MWVLSILALLGAVLSMTSAVAVFPARTGTSTVKYQPGAGAGTEQLIGGNIDRSQCIPTTVITTIYIQPVAIKDPPTVTVVMYDSASIAAQAASDAAIDTEYESEQSQLRPVSAQKPTTPPIHTHVLTAPAFTATEDRGGSFYVVNEPSSTTWGTLPTGNHAAVGTTMVTVGAKPAQTAAAEGLDASGTITYTVSPYPASASGTAVQATGSPASGLPSLWLREQLTLRPLDLSALQATVKCLH